MCEKYNTDNIIADVSTAFIIDKSFSQHISRKLLAFIIFVLYPITSKLSHFHLFHMQKIVLS